MILDRWTEWDMVVTSSGFCLVLRNPMPWSGKMIMFESLGHKGYKVSTIIEEQGVPSVCWTTASVMAHQLYTMLHVLTYQEHSELRGEKQGAD